MTIPDPPMAVGKIPASVIGVAEVTDSGNADVVVVISSGATVDIPTVEGMAVGVVPASVLAPVSLARVSVGLGSEVGVSDGIGIGVVELVGVLVRLGGIGVAVGVMLAGGVWVSATLALGELCKSVGVAVV